MAKRRMKGDEVFDVRVGDRWANYGNSGTTERRIVKVDDVEKWGPHARIYYRDFGGHHTYCLRSTFRRWWRTAFLDFALDWEGRETDGRTLKVPNNGSQAVANG